MGNHRRRGAVVAAVAVVLAACGGGDEDFERTEPPATVPTPTAAATASPTPSPQTTPTPTPTQAETDDVATWASCTNEEHGYTVEHPEDWQTNDGVVLPPCSLFDPGEVEVERGTEIPLDIAVAIRVEPVSLERITRGGRGEEELDREEATAAGRDAVRREVEATGDALRPAGLRSTFWYVSLDEGQTLVASTHDAGDVSYGEKQDVLHRMIESLKVSAE